MNYDTIPIFSLMNLILTKFRTRLSPKMLDTLMRLRLYPADIRTLDRNRITFKFLLKHRTCANNLGGPRRVSEGVQNEPINVAAGLEEDEDEVIFAWDGDNVPMEDENPLGDHCYAHSLNCRKLIQRKPHEEFFEIINTWESNDEGNALTAVSDTRIRTRNGQIGQRNRRWFKSDQFLVADNGKVLQDNGSGEWVTLEHADPAKPEQKWTVRRIDSDYNQLIISGNNNYLEILNDPRISDDLRIGTKDQRRVGYESHSSLWKINSLGDIDEEDLSEAEDSEEMETEDMDNEDMEIEP